MKSGKITMSDIQGVLMPKFSLPKVLLSGVISIGTCPLAAQAASPVASVAQKSAPNSVINNGQVRLATIHETPSGEPLITALPGEKMTAKNVSAKHVTKSAPAQ